MEKELIDEIAEQAHRRNIDIRMIFDVGSHDLAEALYMAEIFPEAHIHAFEANPNNYPGCTERAAGQPRITFHPFGVGDKNASALFNIAVDSRQSSMYWPIRREHNAIEMTVTDVRKIEIRRLDSLGITPDLIFMDIQGSEYDALVGMGTLLNNVKIICVELIILPVLYEDGPLFDAVDSLLKNRFELVRGNPFENEFENFIYIRKDLL